MKRNWLKRIIPVVLLTGGLLMAPTAALESQTPAEPLETGSDVLRSETVDAATDEDKAAWEALETEGPPPWAASRQKDTTGWFDGDRVGPPPWAASHQNQQDKAARAEIHQQWQDSEKDGPPSWAASHQKQQDKAARAEAHQQWQDSEKDGPPPWAANQNDDDQTTPDI